MRNHERMSDKNYGMKPRYLGEVPITKRSSHSSQKASAREGYLLKPIHLLAAREESAHISRITSHISKLLTPCTPLTHSSE